MKQQLKEAEGRGENMKELVDELAAARMRSSALAKELAEQAYAVSIPRESDGLVPKVSTFLFKTCLSLNINCSKHI